VITYIIVIVSAFHDCFRRIGKRTHAWRSACHTSPVSTNHPRLCQALGSTKFRSLLFVLCGTRLLLNRPYKTTNVMHWILFIRQILLLSSTCFEYQVLLKMSTWYSKHVEES